MAAAAVPELERLGDDRGLSRAWNLIADELAGSGLRGERTKALERALGHAQRAGDGGLRAHGSVSAQALFFGPTPVDEAIVRCKDFRAAAPDDRIVQA